MRWGFGALVPLTAVIFLVGGSGGTTSTSGGPQPLDCTKCHTCPNPTPGNPCLDPCPRHEATRKLPANLGPSVVILDQLEDLYVPVRFDHRAHANMSGMMGGCETCHHFTSPDREHPECQSCHPKGVIHENIAQPGLKGAYHRQCMGCHTEWDRATACEICHEKKEGGRLEGTASDVCEHSHYEPVELKELIVFTTSYEKGPQVPFHHRNHSELYERDCSECHKKQSCTRCHVQKQVQERHPMGQPEATNLHDVCFTCHKQQRCGDCHGRDPDDLFNHRETGWPLASYHAKLTCRTCHGQRGEYATLSRDCTTCHPEGWPAKTFRHRVTGVDLGDTHGELECSDCHPGGPGTASDCSGCHDDGRVYRKDAGFGGV